MDDTVVGEILEGIKDVAGDVAGALGQELKKVGHTAASQVSGKAPLPAPGWPSRQEVSKLDKKDKEFSEEAQTEVRSRINAIYAEHAVRQKKLAMQQDQQQSAQAGQKQQILQLKKKEAMDVSLAKAKSNAEIKNYGAE